MTRKHKVLYIVSTLRQSGPITQLLSIISNLDKNNFEPLVLTLSPEPQNSMKKEFLQENIGLASLNLSRKQFLLHGKKELKKYINYFEPNVIHTSGVRADTVVSKLNLETPHCMTIRNFALEDYTAKFGKVIGGIAAQSNIKAMKKCRYVIFCSKTLQRMYEDLLSQKTYVIQNGVNIEKYRPAEDIQMKNQIRDSLQLPNDQIIFLVIGSLIKRKDPLSIINSFKKANLAGKAQLILLGEGELMDQCKNEANESIFVKGNVPNVKDYLKAGDGYISASESEGLPNSVLEAGSSGLNLILSDIPQHREIFERNLDFVKMFQVSETNKLTRQIEKYVQENNHTINTKLAKYIHHNFSNKNMSKKYGEMYEKMIGPGNKFV